MKLIAITIILAGLSCSVYGQEKFWNKIEIKKSFDSKTDKTKPAIASFTIPADSRNYVTINGGIAYRISKLKTTGQDSGGVASKSQLDIFSVYNGNNQVDKEQKNLKAGLTLEKKYLFFGKNSIPKDFMLYVNFSNEYVRDWIDTTNSFASLLYLTPYFRLAEKLKIGKPVMSKDKKILTFLNATPGLEYQNTFDVAVSSADLKGSLVRLYFYASYEWYLRWRQEPGNEESKWVNLLELSGNYTYRNDFYNSSNKREGYLPLVVLNAAIYPFHNNNISFGATYQNGSDPINGIDKQEFWQFVFKFKKDIKTK